MRYETTFDVAAPPEIVYGVISDIGHWPEWTPACKKAELLDDGEMRVGYRARLTMRSAPVAVWTATEVTPGRSFTWESKASGVRTSGWHIAEPSGTGSRVTLGIEAKGIGAVLFGPFISRPIRKNVDDEAAALKRRSELIAKARVPTQAAAVG
jgi:carbon monoxide dehydrogenase subunit G